jgi:predicted permease
VLTLYASVVIRPLPFPDEDRLVRVWSADRSVIRQGRGELSMADVEDIAEQATTLDRFVATARSRIMFLGDRGARRVEGEAVTPGYLTLLDIEPFIGRLFTSEEYRERSEPVMILAHGTWLREFGGDPDVLGSTVRTALRNYTVVGVLRPDFLGTIEEDIPDIEFWVPLVHDRTAELHANRNVTVAWTIGRLGPGVTLAQAQQEISAIGERLSQLYPDTRGDRGLRMERMGENWRQGLRWRNYLLLGAAGLLLVVAAANVAGLLVARSLNRRRELAVRSALGAGIGRLVRQVFAETAVLAAVGGAVGILLAPWVLDAFLSLAPEEVPGYVDVAPDKWALLLATCVVALTALVAGSAPAFVSARVSPGAALRSGDRGNTASRAERSWNRWLVTGEVALTTVLIVTAGLLVRSYRALWETDLGYRTESLLRMAIFVDERDVERRDELSAFYERVRETLRSYPGVEKVGLVWPTVPPSFGGDTHIRFAGMPEEEREHGLQVVNHIVDPEFLPSLDIPVVAGRNIATADVPANRRVALVSESVAQLLGGSEGALGRTLEREGGTSLEIVGVVSDVLYFGPLRRRERDFDIYTSLEQEPQRLISIAIQTAGDPSSFVEPLRQRLITLAPSSPLDWIDPMRTVLGNSFRGPRFYMLLLTAFATSALVLTAVGLFAVLANQVARQATEFGIRQALGAKRGSILRGVLAQGFGLASIGLVAGALAAVGVGRALGATLYGVGAFDRPTFLATGIVVLAVAAAASYLPAARASRVSPMDALREE